MRERPGFRYREFPGGGHDAGIAGFPRMLDEIMQMLTARGR